MAAFGLIAGASSSSADPGPERRDARVERVQGPARPGAPARPAVPSGAPVPPSAAGPRPPAPGSAFAPPAGPGPASSGSGLTTLDQFAPGGIAPRAAGPSPAAPAEIPPPAPRALAPLGGGVAFAPPSAFAPSSGEPGLTSLDQFAPGGIPLMLGDQAPVFARARAGGKPSNAVRLPWVRGYKMADNQSPWPVDRVFVSFNFYDDLNLGAGSPVRDVKVYREFFGFEKTFLADRNASIGLRVPLNTISAVGRTPGAGGTSTALGDLTVFAKYAFLYDRQSGDVAMGGFAVTPNTGPRNFAGASFARARSPVYFQPFVGFVKNFGSWYAQGFSGINVPNDDHVVTIMYNDLAVGTFLYQSADPRRLVSAVIPAMEVHVNTPLNHRGTFSSVGDPGATFDAVDLTFGLNAVLRRRTVLSVGFVEPVTGPRPFDVEIVAMLNVFFGGRGQTVPPIPPPSLGP